MRILPFVLVSSGYALPQLNFQDMFNEISNIGGMDQIVNGVDLDSLFASAQSQFETL